MSKKEILFQTPSESVVICIDSAEEKHVNSRLEKEQILNKNKIDSESGNEKRSSNVKKIEFKTDFVNGSCKKTNTETHLEALKINVEGENINFQTAPPEASPVETLVANDDETKNQLALFSDTEENNLYLKRTYSKSEAINPPKKTTEFHDIPLLVDPIDGYDIPRNYLAMKDFQRIECDLVLDDKFLHNLSEVLELPSYNLRKQKYNKLLKAVKSTAKPENSRIEMLKNFFKNCFEENEEKVKPLKKFRKIEFSSRQPTTLAKRRDSELWLNQTFYHYRMKSKEVGLSFDPKKKFKFGEQGSGFRSKGKPQDFYKLRDEYLGSGSLFEDPEFPATNSSLFYREIPKKRFVWKRPNEIIKNPQFSVNAFSRFSVQEGDLGSTKILAALANLSVHRRLFSEVVPDDQDFGDTYAGIFHFRFWQFGRWIDVVIDDRLPTYEDRLVFLHSTQPHEFWSSLFEKAYAKLYGSYEDLQNVSTIDALEDFTGGLGEWYDPKTCPLNLVEILLKAYERRSVMGCSMPPDPYVKDAFTRDGLMQGHAYSITKFQIVYVEFTNTKVPLVRIRCPWGIKSKWKGFWSDLSPQWTFLSKKQKEEEGLFCEAEGEFWMSFQDFKTIFHVVDICHLDPDTSGANDEGSHKKWVVSAFESEWVLNVTAGGSRHYPETHWRNPQYTVTLDEPDERDNEKKCTLIVDVMDRQRTQKLQSSTSDFYIGFAIYQLPAPDKVPIPLDRKFFEHNTFVAKPKYSKDRKMTTRCRLNCGTYCIMPTTASPDQEGEFLLRVFSEHQNNMKEHDQKLGLLQDEEESSTLQSFTLYTKKDPAITNLFKEMAGPSEEINWRDLKQFLDKSRKKNNTKGFSSGFSKDVCRSMIALLHTYRTGKLNIEEFARLVSMIRNWKDVFKKYDKSNNGTLDGSELRAALNSVGYGVNSRLLNSFIQRYGNKSCQIEFDDFIMCIAKIKLIIEFSKETSQNGENKANLHLSRHAENILYS